MDWAPCTCCLHIARFLISRMLYQVIIIYLYEKPLTVKGLLVLSSRLSLSLQLSHYLNTEIFKLSLKLMNCDIHLMFVIIRAHNFDSSSRYIITIVLPI